MIKSKDNIRYLQKASIMNSAVKAFGNWEGTLLAGNPFAQKGCLKVFMSEPKIPLILDTVNSRIAFIAVRVASSDKFMLPKANRSEEEKAKSSYYALWSPAEEWEISEGGYKPIKGCSAEELANKMTPPQKTKKTAAEEQKEARQESLRDLIESSLDTPPYKNFPLTQRQALQQAAFLQGIPVENYIKEFIPKARWQWAYSKFGIDVPAS